MQSSGNPEGTEKKEKEGENEVAGGKNEENKEPQNNANHSKTLKRNYDKLEESDRNDMNVDEIFALYL